MRAIKVKNSPLFSVLILFVTSLLSIEATGANADPRFSSVICAIEKTEQKVECDYRVSATLEVKEVSLKVDGKSVQIPDGGVTNYPAGGQSTALLILTDVSDPRRKNTVEGKNIQAIKELLVAQKEHQKIGLAVFDSELRVLANIGADPAEIKAAVGSIKATGQATEFYKNILAGIALLQKSDATRKGLIVMSDGKDEDRAYKHADVIKAAQDAGVVILGLGYLERPTDSPYLQTLKRLSEDSYGLYFDATHVVLPAALAGKPFSFVEKGGRVVFDVATYYGRQEVSLNLGLSDSSSVALKTIVEFPDKRARTQQVIDFMKYYWSYLLGGAVLLLIIIFVITKLFRRRNHKRLPVVEYAYLVEMDGSGTRYPLKKTAVCIGRSEGSDILLANDSISSHHAEIHRRREGDFYIVDLASSNGVYVNEVKVTQIELHEGDLIELGEVRLRFSMH